MICMALVMSVTSFAHVKPITKTALRRESTRGEGDLFGCQSRGIPSKIPLCFVSIL